MVHLADMQLLVLITEFGSLAAAARKLNISSAAVSKQLAKMEKELKVQLLLRSTRRIELTTIGRDYYQQCQRVLEEAAQADALIAQMQAEPSGSLRVLSNPHFAATYIVPHISTFLSKYPNIHLNLELGERIPDLYGEGIDVVIGMSISASGDVIQKKIATTSYVYCASPEYLKSFGKPKKPEDLKTHRYLTHSIRRPDDVAHFDRKKAVTVKPYVRVNDVETLLKLALAGVGIVKLHRYVVQKHIESGQLLELFKEENKTEIPLYVAYPQRRFVPSNIRCFIDFFVRQRFGADSA
jgi:DNA-binding transcriptional LysR family regulator